MRRGERTVELSVPLFDHSFLPGKWPLQMADINITHSHSLGLDDGRAAVGRVADKLEQKLGVDAEWAGDMLQFDGQGADGYIEVETDAVHVAINLSAFLQPMRGRVKSEAEDYLDRHLQS